MCLGSLKEQGFASVSLGGEILQGGPISALLLGKRTVHFVVAAGGKLINNMKKASKKATPTIERTTYTSS